MKKATGIVRKIDDLGRITLPKELRTTMGLEFHDPIEIFVDGESIVLQKHTPGCTLCGYTNSEIVSFYPGRLICKGCVQLIVKEHEALVFSVNP